MRPTRRTRRLLAVVTLLVAGLAPCLAVLGYGVYLRSPLYRAAVQRDLTEFFGLPTRVGRVIPLSWDERELRGVEVFLPVPSGEFGPENRVAFCRTAQWLRSTEPGRFDLLLANGAIDLTPARWAQGDFRKLERSLRHDYQELGLHKVGIYRGGFRWAHDEFACELGDAEGEVFFTGRGDAAAGVARLRAGSFNGGPADVYVQARFDPLSEAVRGPGDVGLVREFELVTSPNRPAPIPLTQFRLDELVGGPVTSGQFTGRLSYAARLDGRRNVFTVTDAELTGLQLAEFTRDLPGGPVAGRLDLKVQRMRLEESAREEPGRHHEFYLTDLKFSGVLGELDLARAMATIGLPPCPGVARLEVTDADLMGMGDGEGAATPDAPGLGTPGRAGPIRLLNAAGSVRGLDLGELTGLLPGRFGGGRIRGPARIDSVQLSIVNGQLAVLQADLVGEDPAPGSARPVVDMKLIEAVVPAVGWLRSLPVDLPASLPYQSLKLHAFLNEGKLVVQGLGGGDGKSLMTLLVPTPGWSQALGLGDYAAVNVPAPGFEKPFDLGGLAALLARPIEPIPLRTVDRTVRDRLLAPRADRPE